MVLCCEGNRSLYAVNKRSRPELDGRISAHQNYKAIRFGSIIRDIGFAWKRFSVAFVCVDWPAASITVLLTTGRWLPDPIWFRRQPQVLQIPLDECSSNRSSSTQDIQLIKIFRSEFLLILVLISHEMDSQAVAVKIFGMSAASYKILGLLCSLGFGR